MGLVRLNMVNECESSCVGAIYLAYSELIKQLHISDLDFNYNVRLSSKIDDIFSDYELRNMELFFCGDYPYSLTRNYFGYYAEQFYKKYSTIDRFKRIFKHIIKYEQFNTSIFYRTQGLFYAKT